MNVAEALLHALRRHGAAEIFGIPGDFALAFFKVIEQSGILPLYTLSHEPGVGFAADAAARWRSAPAVAAVTHDAGALNMVNAVANAYAERVPLVVISGAPGATEAGRRLLLHHQVKSLDSQMSIYSEVTCNQARLDDPAAAPAEIARVLHSCVSRSQPVYLDSPAAWYSSRASRCPCGRPTPWTRRRWPPTPRRCWRGWLRPGRRC